MTPYQQLIAQMAATIYAGGQELPNTSVKLAKSIAKECGIEELDALEDAQRELSHYDKALKAAVEDLKTAERRAEAGEKLREDVRKAASKYGEVLEVFEDGSRLEKVSPLQAKLGEALAAYDKAVKKDV